MRYKFFFLLAFVFFVLIPVENTFASTCDPAVGATRTCRVGDDMPSITWTITGGPTVCALTNSYPAGAGDGISGAWSGFTSAATGTNHFYISGTTKRTIQATPESYTFTCSIGSTIYSSATLIVTAAPTYTVTTSAGTGCTVTPGPTTWQVAAGSYLGVNFGANAGYSISDVTVNGVSQGVLNEYNVNNVWQNFNIAVTCVPVAIPAALNICPPSAILGTGGQTQQLQAWYTPAGTSFIDCGNTTGASDVAGTASWSSSSSAVATVSTSGLVTSAGASGQSTDVTAVYAGVNDSAAITLTCIQNVFCTAATQGAVCEGETYTFIDNCGVPHDCDGTRSCNYNWKEVAP
jgi:hypothetical protein